MVAGQHDFTHVGIAGVFKHLINIRTSARVPGDLNFVCICPIAGGDPLGGAGMGAAIYPTSPIE